MFPSRRTGILLCQCWSGGGRGCVSTRSLIFRTSKVGIVPLMMGIYWRTDSVYNQWVHILLDLSYIFHTVFRMRFTAVLVPSNATHFLSWWISDRVAVGTALPREGYRYHFHVIGISLGRIRLTGNMICCWPRNRSWVVAAHVLCYLPWYHEGTERHVGSRPLGMLEVHAYF